MQMFAVRVIPLFLIPFILKDRFYKFLVGYAIPLGIFLLISFAISVSTVVDVSINDRLEVGVFTSIWISRVVLELALLSFIVFALKTPYTLIVFFLAAPVIYASGSKGPLLSFILVMLIWVLRERFITPGQRIKIAILIGILIIGTVSAISLISSDSYFYQRFLLQVPDGSESFDESRGIVWPLVIAKIFTYDFIDTLIGHGIGEFERFFYGTSSGVRYYPHNIFLELIVENGLIVTIFIGGIFAYIYKSSKSSLKYLFLFAFLNAQFSGDILLNEGLFFYAGALLSVNRWGDNKSKAIRLVGVGRNR
jgi:O-antigen ligase